MKSDTPETDAEESRGFDEFGGGQTLVSADFARKLERESAQLRADLLVAQKWDKERFQHNCELISENQELRAELDKANAASTEMQAALSDIFSVFFEDDGLPMYAIAKERFIRNLKALAHAEKSGLA